MKQAVQPEDRKRERESTEFEQGWLPVSGVMMLGRWPKPNGVPHILISRKVKKVYSNHNTTTATLARAGGADVHWRFPEESSQAQQGRGSQVSSHGNASADSASANRPPGTLNTLFLSTVCLPPRR